MRREHTLHGDMSCRTYCVPSGATGWSALINYYKSFLDATVIDYYKQKATGCIDEDGVVQKD